jgi:hypothetical protein
MAHPSLICPKQKRRLPAPLLAHDEVRYLLPQTDELFSPVW